MDFQSTLFPKVSTEKAKKLKENIYSIRTLIFDQRHEKSGRPKVILSLK
ncbi:MAG: hypothetical protein QXQ40_00695 [Candidatus Aenigmatarchaeota archaeon]